MAYKTGQVSLIFCLLMSCQWYHHIFKGTVSLRGLSAPRYDIWIVLSQNKSILTKALLISQWPHTPLSPFQGWVTTLCPYDYFQGRTSSRHVLQKPILVQVPFTLLYRSARSQLAATFPYCIFCSAGNWTYSTYTDRATNIVCSHSDH